MTLASFNKASNVIRQSTERLQGEKPINLIKAARPILILDEPQRMESDLSIESLSSLSPLFALRYSATHRNLYNCVYRLTPYDAYREGLVKQIEVAGVEENANTNLAFVQVKSIQSQKTRVTAKLAVHKLQKNGTVKQTTLTVKKGDDLGTPNKTNLPEYAGYRVNEIDMSWGYVRFDNGVEVKTSESHGADKSAVFEAQIRYTIEEHFRKQENLKDHHIKILSLFFIDKVDNYATENGIIRQLFDKCFNELKQQNRYAAWREKQPEDVQAAYFAQSRKRTGEIVYEDSKTGEAERDSEAYQLIMKDKERLLSFEEPTCFVFSHSALREGWDSPNVFQICTLNQTASEMKKRQEIGRGVRLAVNQEGKRVHDGKLNVLTVIANESYRNYVNQLQTEVLEEFGNATSAPKPKNARERDIATLKKAMMLTPEFEILWEQIKHKTRYKVNIDTDKLITEVVEALDETDIRLPEIIIERGRLVVDKKNEFEDQHIGEGSFEYRLAGGVNVLKLIEHRLAYTTPAMKLTRRTLLEILKRTRNQQAALDNPPEFAKIVVDKIRQKIIHQLIDGIKYEKIGEAYEMSQFDCELESWKDCMEPASRSIYDHVIWDSDVEKQFVKGLERRDDIILYVKLPVFFSVPTPIGNYNPDWAIVKEDRDAHGEPTGKEGLYLVRETKSTTDSGELRLREEHKINCGTRHFRDALGVDYEVVTSAEEV
ncbi:MAG: DEAD/DEAH box helicase [Candidatus Poribacteria bacterium]|nr:DEAD/DEAH box helicase [Candidatus Poribacteria bacterium]